MIVIVPVPESKDADDAPSTDKKRKAPAKPRGKPGKKKGGSSSESEDDEDDEVELDDEDSEDEPKPKGTASVLLNVMSTTSFQSGHPTLTAYFGVKIISSMVYLKYSAFIPSLVSFNCYRLLPCISYWGFLVLAQLVEKELDGVGVVVEEQQQQRMVTLTIHLQQRKVVGVEQQQRKPQQLQLRLPNLVEGEDLVVVESRMQTKREVL